MSFTRARDNMVKEIDLMTGGRWGPDPLTVISTNIALRRDGLPLANQRQPDYVGVAVYFMHKKRQMSFDCDRWDRWDRIEHNMQAITKTIEALRGIARWGTGDILEAAFTCFAALPAPAAAREWWELLSVPRDSSRDVITAAYRRLRSEHHPDRGGSADRFGEVERAYRSAQEVRGE